MIIWIKFWSDHTNNQITMLKIKLFQKKKEYSSSTFPPARFLCFIPNFELLWSYFFASFGRTFKLLSIIYFTAKKQNIKCIFIQLIYINSLACLSVCMCVLILIKKTTKIRGAWCPKILVFKMRPQNLQNSSFFKTFATMATKIVDFWGNLP